jgi:hypothetical protein
LRRRGLSFLSSSSGGNTTRIHLDYCHLEYRDRVTAIIGLNSSRNEERPTVLGRLRDLLPPQFIAKPDDELMQSIGP